MEVANGAVAVSSCQRANPASLAAIDWNDGLALVICFAIVPFSAVFQYKCSSYWCDGNDHLMHELAHTLTLLKNEIKDLAKDIAKMAPGDAKTAQVAHYRELLAQYGKDAAYLQELYDARDPDQGGCCGGNRDWDDDTKERN